MRGVNKVILVGTLGRDPETKVFPSGGSITQFSIATSESWNDKNTGEKIEQTEWHRITLNNKLGEIAQQYLKKGSKVYIEGSLRTRKWVDQAGVERYTTEIRGDSMQMLDSRQGGEYPQSQPQQAYGSYGAPQPQQGGYQQPAYPQSAPQQPAYQQPAYQQPPQPVKPQPAQGGVPELDDDLPF